jgi:hypothetical protein
VKMRGRRRGLSTKRSFSGPVTRRKPRPQHQPQCVSTLSGWGGTGISLGGVQVRANWRYPVETLWKAHPVSARCANDGKPLCEAERATRRG